MTIAFTSLGSRGDTNARSSYTCETSRTPEANTLILVGVLVADTPGTPVQPTGVEGFGLTFSIATSSVTFDTIASPLHNLSLWRAMGSPSGSVVTATFPNNANGCAILVAEVSGVSQAGTNGSSAVSASATSRNDNTSALTTFLPSAASTANGWFVVEGVSASGADSVEAGWVALDSVGHSGPNSNLASAYTTLSDDTQVTWSGGNFDQRATVAVEIVADNPAAGGGAVVSPYYATYYYPQVVCR